MYSVVKLHKIKIKIKFLFLFLFSLFILLSSITETFSYHLVPILGISPDKKKFFINIGENKNLVEGMEATFTSDNTSIIAKAISVSDKISIWNISEPSAIIPFQKDQIVTFNYATEKIWMFDPNNYLTYKKYQKEAEEKKERMESLKTRGGYKHIVAIKRSRFTGETATISQTDSSTITSRNGDIIELMYAYNLGLGIQLGLGYRAEKEYLLSTLVNTTSDRAYFYLDLSYHFIPIEKFSHIYLFLGSSLGSGVSKTSMPEEDISGKSLLFPTLYGGVEYFFFRGHAIHMEGGVETISTKESFANGIRQDTSEVNYKIGIGYSMLFQ
ncbi:MAG: hypothetical protein HQK51_12970 [Oligoflexia bacterium]|nr:hypothetical protein [Oligoflexia bacterium]